MSKQRFLRSLYLWSNSSSLLSGALNLFYLRNNSSPLLSLDSIIGLLKELCLRHNSSPPTLLSSSSLLSSKLKLLLLLLLSSSSSSSSSSPLLPILFLSLPSLARSSSSFAWPEVVLPLHHLFCLHWLRLIDFQLLDSEYQFFLHPQILYLFDLVLYVKQPD